MRGAGDIGVAIAADGLTAVVPGGAARVESVPATLDPAAPDFQAALIQAMRTLHARLDGESARPPRRRIRAVLLPPLAESRLLQLPPLRPAEAAAVVQRDGGRYFVTVAAPRVTAVATYRGAGMPVFATATTSTLLEAVHNAAAAVGWQVAGTASGDAAWLAVAGRSSGAAAVIATHGATAHVLLLHDGVPRLLRRVPAADPDEIVAAAVAAAATSVSPAADPAAEGSADPAAATARPDLDRTVALLVPPHARAALAGRFVAAGWAVDDAAHTAPAAAAIHAARARPQLVASSAEAQRRRAEHRFASWLAAAAVVLLMASALVELWGARRQLDEVRSRRAEIRSQVGPLLSLRDSVDRLDQHSRAIEQIAATAPRWTAALFELAVLLPPETHMTRLHTTGDTVVIEAEGSRAGATLQGLRSASSLRDARMLGAVERELADGTTAVERFRMSARLAGVPPRLGAAATSAPRPAGGGAP